MGIYGILWVFDIRVNTSIKACFLNLNQKSELKREHL